MNGIHDVGGADGFGPIIVEAEEPVWHAEWEKAAFSFFPQSAVAGYFNLDEFRASMERINPLEYLATPYYAHWMHAFEEYLARDDASFPDELERRTQEYLADPAKPLPEDRNPELADIIAGLAAAGAPANRDVEATAKFKIGDRVLVSATVPVNHTRKAGYVRGMVGVIVLAHGGWVFPDANAHEGGEAPEHVYGVQFSAEDLFGVGIGDPKTSVTIDLWESYLSPAVA